MLLFDLDGTLIDSNGVWVEVDSEFLSRRGLSITPEYCHTVGHSILPLAAQFTKDYYHLEDSPQAIMDEWLTLAGDAYANHVPLKPGVRTFLERCSAAGESMVLVTACVPTLCATALKRHDLTCFFPSTISALELGIEKRDPRYFRTVLKQLGVEAKDCTLFEDSPGACKAAKELGIRVVGIYDAFYADYQHEVQSYATQYIHSFEELL